MDMNAQTRNSLLTAMVCVALSSGTAWAATPELEVPVAAVQQAAQMSRPDSRAIAEQATELREMPLRWQAVPTTKELERAAKPQPVIITADDIKAQRKAERKKITAEAVKGQAHKQVQSLSNQPSPSQVQTPQSPQGEVPVLQPAVRQVEPEQKQLRQSAEPAPSPAAGPVNQVQSPQAKPLQPLQAQQPAGQLAERQQAKPEQPLQKVQPEHPLHQARPAQALQQVHQPLPQLKSAQAVKPAQQPEAMQARPLQQQQPVQSVPQASIMQVRSVQSQRSAADSEPGLLKQALQRLREQDTASGSQPRPSQATVSGEVRPRPAAAGLSPQMQQKPLPQIQTAQDAKRPQPAHTSLQPSPVAPQPVRRQGQSAQLPKQPTQIQVERPTEFANVSDEVVRHILAGEFAMTHQLRQDPTEPGVYKLTQILNQNTGLTHLQKIEYLIGFGRAINRSNLTEWQKSALIKSVIEAFE